MVELHFNTVVVYSYTKWVIIVLGHTLSTLSTTYESLYNQKIRKHFHYGKNKSLAN